MSRLLNIRTLWHLFGELDVQAIRAESEQALTVACLGPAPLRERLAALLLATDLPADAKPLRYPAPAADTEQVLPAYTLPLRTGDDARLQEADMLLLALDGTQPLASNQQALLDQLDALSLPMLVVVFGSNDLPAPANKSRPLHLPVTSRLVALPEPDAPDAAEIVAAGLLARLPAELTLAAARRLPGLRPVVARDLISSTSLSNATYALMSGVGEQFPILNIPLAATDILLLTKNQALMVYKLALAHGAPPAFQAALREIVGVIGLAYVWRQIARTLVGMVPVVGLPAQVAVAYAGTYTVGMAATRWFGANELTSREELAALSRTALQEGRALAGRLLRGKGDEAGPAALPSKQPDQPEAS